MEKTMSKLDLLNKIREMHFFAVDLTLFLDTHPNDVQALRDYNYISKSLNQLMEMYNQTYGPLENYGSMPIYGNNWTWVSTDSWPWEAHTGV